MSHPIATREYGDNEYPSDSPHKGGEKSYPQKKKRAKSGGPLHNVADRLNAKAAALKKMLKDAGMQ